MRMVVTFEIDKCDAVELEMMLNRVIRLVEDYSFVKCSVVECKERMIIKLE